MVAKCSCGLLWHISIKTDLSEPYKCPICEAKENKIQEKQIEQVKSKKKEKNEGRISGVLQRNRSKFSISN